MPFSRKSQADEVGWKDSVFLIYQEALYLEPHKFSQRALHRTPKVDRAESREASKQRAEPSTCVNWRGTAEVSGPRSRFILIKIQPRCFCWYLPEAIRCQQSFLCLKAVLNLAIPTPDSYHLSISSHHGPSSYSWTPQGERFFSQLDRLLLPYS